MPKEDRISVEGKQNLNRHSRIPTTNNNINLVGSELIFAFWWPPTDCSNCPTALMVSIQVSLIPPAFSVSHCTWHSLGWAVSPLDQD